MPIIRDIEKDYPQRVSRRMAVEHYDEDRYYHGREKWKLMDNLIEGIIREHIGKSVDKAYTALIKKFAKGWDSFPYRSTFFDKLGVGKWSIWHSSRYDNYYVKDGIIKKFKKETKDRSFRVGGHYEKAIILSMYPSWRYMDVKPIIEPYFKQMGWDLWRHFTKEECNNLIDSMVEWYARHPEKALLTGVDPHKRKVTPDMFRHLLEEAFEEHDVLVDQEKIKPHTKEWDTIKSENKRKHRHHAKKKWRQEFMVKYDKTLWEKKKTRLKKLDSDADVVTRDRLGFDDESFKGEFYHGQKRKKNKQVE